MIKFLTTREDGPLIGFGLSRENMRRLMEDQPILIDLTQFGLTGQVVIFGGETEAEMANQLKDHFGPNTRLLIDDQTTGNS